MKPIPIIDLFAGPGGLGEGFTSVEGDDGNPVFDIKLSIKKMKMRTRHLPGGVSTGNLLRWQRKVPGEYYQAYRKRDLKIREEIIETALNNYPEGEIARKEARLVELGSNEWPARKVDKFISDQLGKKPGNWVLIGGPPCQAYSNVGRSRVGGINKDDHRVYLYQEYLRIIKDRVSPPPCRAEPWSPASPGLPHRRPRVRR